MRNADVAALFDYNYWATWQVLEATKRVPRDEFVSATDVTWRNLRGTLVHTLDVERSWRLRLQGAEKYEWDAELPAERFATASELESEWRLDADVMRAWLKFLSDEQLLETADLSPRDRFPLWYYLVHVVTHGIEQRRDAATLIKLFGHGVPDLEFLWYADSLNAAVPDTEGIA